MLKKKSLTGGYFLPKHRLSAPSWVIPGTLAENCGFLATKVDEVGLLFMESDACLKYGPEDIPENLADLPLTFHVHLPVDLPIRDDPSRAAAICLALLGKTVFLAQREENMGRRVPHLRGVLHPPAEYPGQPGKASCELDVFIRTFQDMGGEPALLMLENIKENNLLRHMELALVHSMSICLDLGHALAYRQFDLLTEDALPQMLGMLHLNAPGPASCPGRHLPLAALDERGRETAARLCSLLPPGKVIMLELFDWSHIKDSLPLLLSWLSQ